VETYLHKINPWVLDGTSSKIEIAVKPAWYSNSPPFEEKKVIQKTWMILKLPFK